MKDYTNNQSFKYLKSTIDTSEMNVIIQIGEISKYRAANADPTANRMRYAVSRDITDRNRATIRSISSANRLHNDAISTFE